jgi:hypothetical protein
MSRDKNKEESETSGAAVARGGDTIRSLPNSTGVSQRGVRTPSYAQSQYETVIRRQRTSFSRRFDLPSPPKLILSPLQAFTTLSRSLIVSTAPPPPTPL